MTAPAPPTLWPHRLAALGLSFLLFAIACSLPALSGLENNALPISMSGVGLLLTGWTGLFVGQFAWCANVLLPLAWLLLLCRLWIASAVAALLGVLVAMHTFAIVGRDLPADEGAVNRMVYNHLGPAFYVWVAAFLAVAIAALLLRVADRRTIPPIEN